MAQEGIRYSSNDDGKAEKFPCPGTGYKTLADVKAFLYVECSFGMFSHFKHRPFEFEAKPLATAHPLKYYNKKWGEKGVQTTGIEAVDDGDDPS